METPYLDRLKEGSEEVIPTGSIPIPDDFDKAKFRRGQQFFKTNLFTCSLAMAISLIWGFSVRQFLDVLLATGESSGAKKAGSRYLQTYLHVLKWHYQDVWDPSSKAWQSIQTVRRMHHQASELMKRRTGPTKIYVSQYDMAVVQCGFVGAILMYGPSLGVVGTKADYDDYVYFWRWIGFMLGISDKYNLCYHGYEEAFRICKDIERGILLPSMLDPPEDYRKMGQDALDGSPLGGRIFNQEIVAAWAFKMAGVDGPPLSRLDRLRVTLFHWQFLLVMYVPVVRTVLNKLIEWVFIKKAKA